MQVKHFGVLVVVVILAVALSGCFPFGPEDVSEFDIVATFYNENFNFGAVRTFAMPDSIAHITSGTSSISRVYDDIIITMDTFNSIPIENIT